MDHWPRIQDAPWMFSQQPLLYVSWGCDWEFMWVIVFLKRFLYKSRGPYRSYRSCRKSSSDHRASSIEAKKHASVGTAGGAHLSPRRHWRRLCYCSHNIWYRELLLPVLMYVYMQTGLIKQARHCKIWFHFFSSLMIFNGIRWSSHQLHSPRDQRTARGDFGRDDGHGASHEPRSHGTDAQRWSWKLKIHALKWDRYLSHSDYCIFLWIIMIIQWIVKWI
jgi:hypothetical protein